MIVTTQHIAEIHPTIQTKLNNNHLVTIAQKLRDKIYMENKNMTLRVVANPKPVEAEGAEVIGGFMLILVFVWGMIILILDSKTLVDQAHMGCRNLSDCYMRVT